MLGMIASLNQTCLATLPDKQWRQQRQQRQCQGQQRQQRQRQRRASPSIPLGPYSSTICLASNRPAACSLCSERVDNAKAWWTCPVCVGLFHHRKMSLSRRAEHMLPPRDEQDHPHASKVCVGCELRLRKKEARERGEERMDSERTIELEVTGEVIPRRPKPRCTRTSEAWIMSMSCQERWRYACQDVWRWQ